MEEKILSIIIVSYKNLDILIDCLDSIYRYNDIGDSLEVIVVDNSPNETYIYNYIKKNYSNVILIKNENKGFGQGNNVGVRQSSGKYLLFLNPDTILIEPIMKFAIDKFKDEYLALFGVKLVDNNRKSNSSFFFTYKSSFTFNQLNKILNLLNFYIPNKMFISGANMFIPKEIFIKAGMFDENIFMYFEEIDLINRINLLNPQYKVAFFKDKKIVHLEGKSTDEKIESLEIRLKSSHYFAEKYSLDKYKIIHDEYKYNKIKSLVYFFYNKRKYKESCEKLKIFKKYLEI